MDIREKISGFRSIACIHYVEDTRRYKLRRDYLHYAVERTNLNVFTVSIFDDLEQTRLDLESWMNCSFGPVSIKQGLRKDGVLLKQEDIMHQHSTAYTREFSLMGRFNNLDAMVLRTQDLKTGKLLHFLSFPASSDYYITIKKAKEEVESPGKVHKV